jgi:hypothetical protein
MSEQSMQALALANHVHHSGARFRRMVAQQPAAEARITLAQTLERNGFEPGVGALPLHKFLKAARGIGETKAETICSNAGLWRTNPRIRDLTLRERSALAGVLRHNAQIVERNNRAAR